MKKSYLLWIVVTALLLLSGCTMNRDYQKAQVRNDLVQENWMNHFNMNPKAWTASADGWFFNNYPSSFNQYAPDATASTAITVAQVRAPNFTRIKIEGPYLVQIYGSSCNSVFVLGSNSQIRHTQIEFRNDALYVRPAPDCNNCGNFNNVIVRIGIRDLNFLYHAGTGLVEGKNIRSHCMVVKSTNSGSVLLAGNMNVTNVIQGGRGTISLLGVIAPSIAVSVLNDGNVNLTGRIGVNKIIKHGFGCLNIQGADSDSLMVDANNGVTTVSGFVNLQKINTAGMAQVYIYWVNSHAININTHGNSRLGIAGNAQALNIAVDGNARFEGKCMHANDIYVQTAGGAHANVSPDQKLFADAKDTSSIYFYSSPNAVSRYNQGQGLVVPIFNEGCKLCPPTLGAQCAKPCRTKRACHRAHKPVCKTVKVRRPPCKVRRIVKPVCKTYPMRKPVYKTHRVVKSVPLTPRVRTTTVHTNASVPLTPRVRTTTVHRSSTDITYHGEKPYVATPPVTSTTTILHPRPTYQQYKTTQGQ